MSLVLRGFWFCKHGLIMSHIWNMYFVDVYGSQDSYHVYCKTSKCLNDNTCIYVYEHIKITLNGRNASTAYHVFRGFCFTCIAEGWRKEHGSPLKWSVKCLECPLTRSRYVGPLQQSSTTHDAWQKDNGDLLHCWGQMTHKITHVKRRSSVQSGPDQGSLSEYGHNGSETEGNRSVKAVQSILRHWGAQLGYQWHLHRITASSKDGGNGRITEG